MPNLTADEIRAMAEEITGEVTEFATIPLMKQLEMRDSIAHILSKWIG